MSAVHASDPALLSDLDLDVLDPGRWLTLAILVVSAFIVVLDNTVLNVAIPTILRDFDTSLLSIEWVITGYALTFASLLIIGGRLGDIYGHRRIFIAGCAFFSVGSLVAALSQGVPELILGEAVIEGIGASLMLPATIAILSSTFRGRERATAFAAWGAAAGVGSAIGPTVGGLLTTHASWRWAFGINVIVAPVGAPPEVAGVRRTNAPKTGRSTLESAWKCNRAVTWSPVANCRASSPSRPKSSIRSTMISPLPCRVPPDATGLARWPASM